MVRILCKGTYALDFVQTQPSSTPGKMLIMDTRDYRILQKNKSSLADAFNVGGVVLKGWTDLANTRAFLYDIMPKPTQLCAIPGTPKTMTITSLYEFVERRDQPVTSISRADWARKRPRTNRSIELVENNCGNIDSRPGSLGVRS